MSVIAKEKKEIEVIIKSMQESPVVHRALDYSKDFSHYQLRAFRKPTNTEELDNFKRDYLGRLAWYLWVANKTAYALQYREEPGFFDESLDSEKAKPIHKEKDLLIELESLDYNIFTNDGNKFIADEWYKPFQKIIETLKHEVKRNQNIYEI